MNFFVDTADIAEIRELEATGLLDGVTTNPTLIHKSGRKFMEVIAEICATRSSQSPFWKQTITPWSLSAGIAVLAATSTCGGCVASKT